MHQVLFTPWRYAYITGQTQDAVAVGDCFFCAAARAGVDEEEHLVVYRSEFHLVVLNRHPYNSGHLMIAPLVHLASPEEAEPAARAELWPLVLKSQEILREAYTPHGMNLGMNLGSAAGAGVPGHWHFHLVPRWQGDANFMGVVGDVRLVPEEPEAACRRLRRFFAQSIRDQCQQRGGLLS